MNWIGLSLVLMGIIYLIYSILSKDKVNYYSRRFRKRNKMEIINLSEFLRLQFNYSILNSMFCIGSGILIVILNLDSLLIIVVALVFSLINFLLAVNSKMKGYVYYK